MCQVGPLLVRVERQLGPNVVNCGGAIVQHSGREIGILGGCARCQLESPNLSQFLSNLENSFFDLQLWRSSGVINTSHSLNPAGELRKSSKESTRKWTATTYPIAAHRSKLSLNSTKFTIPKEAHINERTKTQRDMFINKASQLL